MAVTFFGFQMLALRTHDLNVHELRAEVTGLTHRVARSQQHSGHQAYSPSLICQEEQVGSLQHRTNPAQPKGPLCPLVVLAQHLIGGVPKARVRGDGKGPPPGGPPRSRLPPFRKQSSLCLVS